jgi:tetratricopeptide (TPR) repeat protein
MSEIVEAYKKTAKRLLDNPDDPEQLSNQYTLLSTTPRLPSHLALAKRCVNVAPTEFIALFNYAAAMMKDGRNSVAEFRRALEFAPPDRRAVTLHHLGLAHYDAAEYDQALNYYRLAKEANADEPLVNGSIALAKMAQGQLREGLHEFEVINHKPVRKPITDSGIPRWNGESLDGKTVILAHEQGFGDTLQFIRFAPLLKRRCKKLIFSGPETLTGLIKDNFKFDAVIGEEGPFKADYVTSCMAAAALMGIEYKDIDGLEYMRAKMLILPKRGKLNVGLSWKGSPGYAMDALRSATLKDFCPLFDLPGAAFYSLQVRPGPQEITNLGLDGFIADLGSTIKDFRDTARAIAAMDVLVATDSANAHMAGALGVPVLLMLGRAACWRWMRSDETPWYEHHKIFRQTTVDQWPIEAVRKELEVMLAGR